MARRHRPPESAHVMRWMVSYADFVTLLFAFFVVMYAISSVNNKKFDQLSAALVGVFETPPTSWQAIEFDTLLPGIISGGSIQDALQPDSRDGETQALIMQLEDQLAKEITPDHFALMSEESWIHLEIDSAAFFENVTIQLSEDGEQLLNRLGKIFSGFGHPINIEAFIDQASALDSPWLLSAQQASAIAYHLMIEGIAPQRLAVISYGPFQPIATQEDEEGRSLNRRIVFLIDHTGLQRERIKTVTKRHLSAKP